MSFKHQHWVWLSPETREMPTKKPPMRMPHFQIRQASLLRLEAKMGSSQFARFTCMVRSTVKDCLNDLVRVEDQEPGALEMFLNTVNERDPTVAEKYEYSWVVLAYLELYINSRRRHVWYQDRHHGERQRFMRCPEPIWKRFAQAQLSGVRLQRNSQACPRAASLNPRLPRRARKNVLGTRTTDVRKPAATKEAAVDKLIDARQHSVTAGVDPVRDFLRAIRPPLEDFYSHFMDMGIKTSADLSTLFSWPIGDQESAMRMQFDQKMNFMQLNGLVVGLRERARSG
ncbi:hypothetical protein PAXRUDRAFT_552503 [Paxillus rubicundulus Ve08.2h10]|uniref:Uncharacterized protein n=1 Tax=Paxillus rubicundulus Ve08.2h10 TaxID=930991 RepID=A0A0D0E9C2_9AGAM|nr:hypothetical protein PAXRUDRAFT_552503 [Paxillus rubicundulus Ve08.2h10]